MAKKASILTIPRAGTHTLVVDGREVRLTNLDKLFWTDKHRRAQKD